MKKVLITLGIALGFVEAQSMQKVIIEKHTGAWCGYCPDGALIMDDILTASPNAIGVAMHNGDGMYNSIAGTVQGFYSPAYPQATINRQGAPISRGAWQSAVNLALQKEPVVAVSIDSAGYEASTRTLKVKVKATFLRDTTGMLRFNMYLLEDGVTGTGSSFNQVNYFNTTSGHPLQGLGNPIVNYVHNNVFRDAAGGAWGNGGFIPSTVLAGESYFLTYTKVLSANWNTANMRIVAMVNMHGSTLRPILNAEVVPFSFATSFEGDPSAAGLELSIYPNPLQSRSTISFNLAEAGRVVIDVHNMAGQLVTTIGDDITNAGMHSVIWDGNDQAGRPVSNGLYLVRLKTEAGGQIAKRVLVNH
jgi:Outer membrane protein Omp28/FlgD Ig-like domain